MCSASVPCRLGGRARGDPGGIQGDPLLQLQGRAEPWGISNWEPGGKHFQAPRDKAGMLWWHRRGREAELFLTPDTSRWLWAEGTAKHQRSRSRAGEFPAQAVLLLSQGWGRHRGSSVPSAVSFRGNESPGHSWSCSPPLSVLRAFTLLAVPWLCLCVRAQSNRSVPVLRITEYPAQSWNSPRPFCSSTWELSVASGS